MTLAVLGLGRTLLLNTEPLSLPKIISSPENPVEGEEFLCFIHDLNENPALTNTENESVLIEKSCRTLLTPNTLFRGYHVSPN